MLYTQEELITFEGGRVRYCRYTTIYIVSSQRTTSIELFTKKQQRNDGMTVVRWRTSTTDGNGDLLVGFKVLKLLYVKY